MVGTVQPVTWRPGTTPRMDPLPSATWPLLGLLAAWPAWKALHFLLVARAMRGMHLIDAYGIDVDESDVPPAAREAITRAAGPLAALGFAPGAWRRLVGPWVGRETWLRIFQGDGPTIAVAQPAAIPTPTRPCDISFLTYRADGAGRYTMYGEDGRVIGRMGRTSVVTGYPDTTADLLALHEAGLAAFLEGQAPVRLDPDELRARSDAELGAYADGLVADGLPSTPRHGRAFRASACA